MRFTNTPCDGCWMAYKENPRTLQAWQHKLQHSTKVNDNTCHLTTVSTAWALKILFFVHLDYLLEMGQACTSSMLLLKAFHTVSMCTQMEPPPRLNWDFIRLRSAMQTVEFVLISLEIAHLEWSSVYFQSFRTFLYSKARLIWIEAFDLFNPTFEFCRYS